MAAENDKGKASRPEARWPVGFKRWALALTPVVSSALAGLVRFLPFGLPLLFVRSAVQRSLDALLRNAIDDLFTEQLASDAMEDEREGSRGREGSGGRGAAGDGSEAAARLYEIAERGEAAAQFRLGVLCASGRCVVRDDAEAAMWWRKAAERGYARAQFALGGAYRMGRGVEKDDLQAAIWTREAAERGLARAQACIGAMNYEGVGRPKDYTEAMRWVRRAAERGERRAQFGLGLGHYSGMGVIRDVVWAHMWLNLAAARGQPGSAEWRDKVEKRMTSLDLSEARRLARAWVEGRREWDEAPAEREIMRRGAEAASRREEDETSARG